MSTVSTDPIADMLTRIRNAINVRHSQTVVPYSKIKESIAKLLQDNNFIDGVQVDGEGIAKSLIIKINSSESNPRITSIKRISTPGRRNYTSADTIPRIKSGRGIVIISTSQGLMTGAQAVANRLGGELICEVY
jgi:small subunit ribosomal protein S8